MRMERYCFEVLEDFVIAILEMKYKNDSKNLTFLNFSG